MNIRESRILFHNLEAPVPSEPEEPEQSKEKKIGSLRREIEDLAPTVENLSKNLRDRAKNAAAFINSKFNGFRFKDGDGFFVVRDIASLKAAINLAQQRGEGHQWEKWSDYLKNYIADEQSLRALQGSLREKQSALSALQGKETKDSLSQLRSEVEAKNMDPIATLKAMRRRAAEILRALMTAGNPEAQEMHAREFFRLQEEYSALFLRAYRSAQKKFESGNTELLIPMRRRGLKVDANHPSVRAMEKIRDEYTGLAEMDGSIQLWQSDIAQNRNQRETAEAILKRYETK